MGLSRAERQSPPSLWGWDSLGLNCFPSWFIAEPCAMPLFLATCLPCWFAEHTTTGAFHSPQRSCFALCKQLMLAGLMGEIPWRVFKTSVPLLGFPLLLPTHKVQKWCLWEGQKQPGWWMKGRKDCSSFLVWLVKFCISPSRRTEQFIPKLCWREAG